MLPHSIVVLGSGGMLGNVFTRICHEYPTIRFTFVSSNPDYLALIPLAKHSNSSCILFSNYKDLEALRNLAGKFPRSSLVVNCIGITKQKMLVHDPSETLFYNSILPKRLSHLLEGSSSRLVQVSTDCIYNGLTGGYTEDSLPNADDLYGVSKYLGEVTTPPHLTIRTSIIGHEVSSSHSLLDWFLQHNDSDTVNGYTNAIYSGITTLELAHIIVNYIPKLPDLLHPLNIAGPSISKLDLLRLVNSVYHRSIHVVPVEHPVINRTLKADRFNALLAYEPPTWIRMLSQLRKAYTPST